MTSGLLLSLDSAHSVDEEIKIFTFSTPPRRQQQQQQHRDQQQGLPNNNQQQQQQQQLAATEKLDIYIPNRPKAGYSLHPWPCASILAWFLWDRRLDIADRRILEIGAGTALPGILAAKCGAYVTLSDSCTLPKTLANIRRCCELNQLEPGRDIRVVGLSWGLLPGSIDRIGALDYIIASDCFYDPTVFEDILVTVAYLLERNPAAKFVCAYQVRSEDWSLEALLQKWQLIGRHVCIDRIGGAYGVDLQKLMGKHSIFLLEIARAN